MFSPPCQGRENAQAEPFATFAAWATAPCALGSGDLLSRVGLKCEQQDGTGGDGVFVAGFEARLAGVAGDIRVDQQRPLPAAGAVGQSELHQFMMAVND